MRGGKSGFWIPGLLAVCLLAGCWGNSKQPPPDAQQPRTYTVGGTVSGLAGTVTLANNGGDTTTVSASGAFTFPTALAAGAAYNVSIASQPANQTCTLANATGTLAAASISSVTVSCETYRIVASIGPLGGTVTGPGGAQVIVPAGALDQATEIGVARPASGWPLPLPDDATLAGSVYELTPHDLIFRKPVVIRLPVPAGAGHLGMLVASFGEGWQHQDVLQATDYIELERSTFSWYAGYGLMACAYSGPPQVGACTTPHASGHTWATATPANALVMTSGGSVGYSPTNTYSAVGSAGTWSVDLDTLQTLHLTMVHTSEPDCGNAHLQLRRMVTGSPTVTVRDVQINVPPSGTGRTTIDIPRAELDEGQSVYFLRFACTRPGHSERGGGDVVTFHAGHLAVDGFTVGGTVSGLSATGLQLQLGFREILDVPAGAGAFAFSAPLASGMHYEARVRAQPQGARCTLANATGTIHFTHVTDIQVSCTPNANAQIHTVVANGTAGTATLFGRQSGATSLTPLHTANTGSESHAVGITRFGPFIYVANMVGGFISPFSIDATTNTLVTIPQSSWNTPNPSALAIDPVDNTFLWVTNYNYNTISAFRIDPLNGRLDPRGTVPMGRLSSAIAAHPNGNFVFAVSEGDYGIYRYQVDRGTGALAALGSLPNAVSSGKDLVITPSGSFGYALGGSGNITRLSINASNGQLSVLGYTSISGVTNCRALAIHPNGSLLFATCSSSLGSFLTAYTIDPATGALTLGARTAIGVSSPATMAIERGGRVMHVANQVANRVYTFSLDPNTGALTETGSVTTGSGPMAIASVP